MNSFLKCLTWVVMSEKVLQVDDTAVTPTLNTNLPQVAKADALPLAARTGCCASSFPATFQLTGRFSIVQSLKIQKMQSLGFSRH